MSHEDTPNHPHYPPSGLIHTFDFVDQLPLIATRLVDSGRQSAVPVLIKETAWKKGEAPLGGWLLRSDGRPELAGHRPPA